MSVTPMADNSPTHTGEVRDQNSLSSSSPQTLNYDRQPHSLRFTGLNLNPHTTNTQLAPYRECLKNHAAAVGVHVVDGCGEFMPGGEEGTLESLKCAACECHRNFHRRVEYHVGFHHPILTTPATQLPSSSSLIPPHHHSRPGQAFPIMMAFGGCNSNVAGADSITSSDEDLISPVFRSGKKRFRTKFSAEQKDQMWAFAEKLGWKICKEDDHDLSRFCGEMGIKRQVFKVWMHNSKQALKKKKIG